MRNGPVEARVRVPAFPALVLVAETIAPLLSRICPARTLTSPPSPLLVALDESPVPPDMVREFAATLIVPPWPAPEVLLSMRPPASVNVPTFSTILPALPASVVAPVVATEIFPPPISVRLGVATMICPALPTLWAVLKIPLCGSVLNGLAGAPPEVPEINTALVAGHGEAP